MSAPIAPPLDATWWRQAVVYQIYPRSFADSNADGLGDLAGITSRADYLEDLGIDAVWLSPFYPSALADGGYDVDDYRDVDPRLGTLADFDAMAAELKRRGIKIIVDIVPNHTGSRHRWFTEALAAGRGSDARDRYIFRDGTGPDGSEPPTDWESTFGGSAWEQVEDGQWYLHLFAVEQPDLNWDRRDVKDEFLTTLRFWADRGVDGFRIDVAQLLAKDLSEPLPSAAALRDGWTGPHPYEDRDEVHEIYAEWRQLFDSYDPPRTAVAEAWVSTERRPRYASPEGLGQAFNFDLLLSPWDAPSFRDVIVENLDLVSRSGSSSTWVLSNHDLVRHATRYGLQRPGELLRREDVRSWLLTGGETPALDVELGLRRARAATMLILALPGSTYVYQGEELGLQEVADIPDDARQDPTFFRSPGVDVGRDGCRVPLPWTPDGIALGFGEHEPHLPQPSWFADYAVSVESADEDSTLNLYRSALAARSRLQTEESLTWVDDGDEVVHFVRPNGWHSVTNLGTGLLALPTGEVQLSSGPLTVGGDGAPLLPPDTTVWLVVS